MSPTLYYMAGSAPCHQVMLTARALGIDLELKHIDLFKDEHLTPEFLKINPQHTVPTLVDGDLVLWESRAISRYLVNKHRPGDRLYPAEPRARARVDQILDFEFGTLYERFGDYYYPQLFEGLPGEESKREKMLEAFSWLEQFLSRDRYVAGPADTIADLAVLASVAVFEATGIDFKNFPKIHKWLQQMKSETVGYQQCVANNLGIYTSFAEKQKNK